jgi:hypothetical protein
MTQRRAGEALTEARARGAKTSRSAAERAKDLLAGGRVDPTLPGPAIAAIDEELRILQDAISEKTRALDEIARDLSYAESEKAKPQFDAAMRDALTAMALLAAATSAASELASRLYLAGYKPSGVLLPNLLPEQAWQLGDPDKAWSPAWKFRQQLQEREHA